MRPDLVDVKVGDVIVRQMAGANVDLKVLRVTDTLIICGPWEFDKATGAEIDAFLHWGPPPLVTGSFIVKVKPSSPALRT